MGEKAQKPSKQKTASGSAKLNRGRLGLVIFALLTLEAGALGLKAWDEIQLRDTAHIDGLTHEAHTLAANLTGQAETARAAILLGQKAGAGRDLIADTISPLETLLSLRDAAAAPDGSREAAAGDAAVQALARGETITLSRDGDIVVLTQQTGFPAVLGFAPAADWLPDIGVGARAMLAGDTRVSKGDPALATQADTATLAETAIQSGEGLVRSATACAPLAGTTIQACVTRHTPQIATVDMLRLATYALLLAAPLLAIIGLMNIANRSRRDADDASDRAENAQAQLDLVMSGARAGSWRWFADSQTAELSPMAAELLRLPSAGEYGVDVLIAQISEADRTATRIALDDAVEKGWLQITFSTAESGGREFVELRASRDKTSGSSNEMGGIVIDVTENRLSDIRLRKAERRLRNAIEGFVGPFALWDNRKRLLYWNRAFALSFSLTDALRPGISHETVLLARAGAIRSEKLTHDSQESQLVELHTGRWLNIVERKTAEGGMITVAVDVTENIHNELLLGRQKQELKTLVARLERSEGEQAELARKYDEEKRKAEHAAHTKSAFLANMSHELRTPLNAINGFSEILVEQLYGPLGDERYKEYAGDILASGQHLLDLINDILDMAKIESGKMSVSLSRLDVVDPVDAAIRMVRRKAEDKQIQLVLDAPSDLPEIDADHRAIRQMVLNLVSNALKFTDEGGCVIVAIRVQDKMMRISVIDNGIGIPRDQITRLGRPFEQITDTRDRNYEGTGLGLALTKSFAEMHNGRLAIASELGKGTRVSIYLPLYHESEKSTATDLDRIETPPAKVQAS